MKSKRPADVFFVFTFLLFIVVVMAVTIFKPKLTSSYYEQRTLAAQPEFDIRNILSNDYTHGWEEFFTDHAAGRQTMLIAGTTIDLKIRKRPVVNDVVVLDGLYLRFNEYDPVDETLIRERAKTMADEMSAFNDIVSSYGGSFYYVAVPTHYIWFDDQYPWYLDDRKQLTKVTLDAFSSDMADAGVDLLLPFSGLTPESTQDEPPLFSTSDHHYTFFGAYKTYRTIIERINSDGIYQLPLLDYDDFEFFTLPNPFMGSRMRSLMGVPGMTERATIAVLNEEIPFTRNEKGVQFENPIVYFLPDDPWEVVDYGIYMGGDVEEVVIDTGRNLPNILLFGDSYTNAVECLLYTSCGEMRSVDLRHYKDMPLSEYVQIFKPDIVVCLRGYSAILEYANNGKVMS